MEPQVIIAVAISVLTFIMSTVQTFKKASKERVQDITAELDRLKAKVKELEGHLKTREEHIENLLEENLMLMRKLVKQAL